MNRLFVCLAALFAAACAPTVDLLSAHTTSPAIPACSLSDGDRAWIQEALNAWRLTSQEITRAQVASNVTAVFFDGSWVLTSPNALTSTASSPVIWRAEQHGDTVTLPNGSVLPVGVVSFARFGSKDNEASFFVMSTPSIWRAGGVDNVGIGLEMMMTAVLQHEASHVLQAATYGARVTALAEANQLPESFNDDSMQEDFGDNADFSASVARETELFFAAAAADDDQTAWRLAREARAMMKARAARWFVEDKAYYSDAEDLWLTLEGSGQWAGYQWLVHPEGAGQPASTALEHFGRRGRWWSQNEGLAIALTLDRLGVHDWPAHAFGDGAQTFLQMLDAALDLP
jgi:hypothetical protein